jgi:hypothetical protein
MQYYKKPATLNLAEYLFKNDFEEDCAFSKCTLLAPGCQEAYTGKKLELLPNHELTSLEQSATGFQDEFCFKCLGPKNSIEKDNVVYT